MPPKNVRRPPSPPPVPASPRRRERLSDIPLAQQLRIHILVEAGSNDTVSSPLSSPLLKSPRNTVSAFRTQRIGSSSTNDETLTPLASAPQSESDKSETDEGESSMPNRGSEPDGPSLRPSASMAIGDNDSEEDDGPSFGDVRRGGSRRTQPSTKSALQAAFDAAAAAQNARIDSGVGFAYGDDGDSEDDDAGMGSLGRMCSSAVNDGDEGGGGNGGGDAPSFAGVGRGGTFRMDTQAREVPDALKDLEFDGSANGTGGSMDAATRVSEMMSTIDSKPDNECETTLYDLQKLLPSLFDLAFDMTEVVSTLCSCTSNWPRNLQITSAETLQQILVVPVARKATMSVCGVAFRMLKEKVEPLIYEVWGDVLVRAVSTIEWRNEDLVRFFAVMDTKKDPERLLAKRLVARLLGSFALGLDKLSVEKLILPRVIAMASDRDAQVRGMIAESLNNIGCSLPIRVVESEMWPAVRAIVKDAEPRVRAAGLRSIADLVTGLQAQNRRSPLYTKLLPSLFVRCCREARETASKDQRFLEDYEYLNLEIKAMSFGKLLVAVFRHLRNNEERKEALKAYLAMSVSNAPVVRRHCAFNLPGVASVFAKRYRTEICGMVGFFSTDDDKETRWKLAAGLHETVRLLSARDSWVVLFEAVQTLLDDKNALVRLNVVRHFHETISELAKQRSFSSSSRLSTLFSKLHLQCEGNWRAQELLGTQLKETASLVPPRTISGSVLPVLYALAQRSVWRVRKVSMEGIAACIRYLCDTNARAEAMKSFEDNWARSKAYWMRLAFIYSAESATTSFSRLLFCDTFAVCVLRLASDPISNVRLGVAKILPAMAPAASGMEEFGIAVKTLMKDEDPDVLNEMEDWDNRVKVVLEKSEENLERDLDLEEEEQVLHAKYIQTQRSRIKMKLLGRATNRSSEGPAVKKARSKDELDLPSGAKDDQSLPQRSASSGVIHRMGSMGRGKPRTT